MTKLSFIRGKFRARLLYLHSFFQDLILRGSLFLRWICQKVLFDFSRPPKPSDVVAVLTTFGPRAKFLRLAVLGLVTQSRPPKLIHIYLFHADEPKFRALEEKLVSEFSLVRFSYLPDPDTKSYKRYQAFADYPSEKLLFVDDDYYVRRRLVEDTIAIGDKFPESVVCHRAAQILRVGEQVMPYASWPTIREETVSRGDLVANTGAGTLYPPGRGLHLELRPDVFMALAPDADDLWMFFVCRKLKIALVATGKKHREILTWRGSQTVALWHSNLSNGGNDKQFTSLQKFFGPT